MSINKIGGIMLRSNSKKVFFVFFLIILFYSLPLSASNRNIVIF